MEKQKDRFFPFLVVFLTAVSSKRMKFSIKSKQENKPKLIKSLKRSKVRGSFIFGIARVLHTEKQWKHLAKNTAILPGYKST